MLQEPRDWIPRDPQVLTCVPTTHWAKSGAQGQSSPSISYAVQGSTDRDGACESAGPLLEEGREAHLDSSCKGQKPDRKGTHRASPASSPVAYKGKQDQIILHHRMTNADCRRVAET